MHSPKPYLYCILPHLTETTGSRAGENLYRERRPTTRCPARTHSKQSTHRRTTKYVRRIDSSSISASVQQARATTYSVSLLGRDVVLRAPAQQGRGVGEVRRRSEDTRGFRLDSRPHWVCDVAYAR
eukprot:scaffold9336_cov133-Isochrysis_galbana.AAC.8